MIGLAVPQPGRLIAQATPSAVPRRDPAKLDGDDVDAVVQVGTNLSMAAARRRRPSCWLGKPVIAINTATYWYALRDYGIRDKVHGWGSLLAEH